MHPARLLVLISTLTDNFSLDHYRPPTVLSKNVHFTMSDVKGLWRTSKLGWHRKDIGFTGVDEKESSPKRHWIVHQQSRRMVVLLLQTFLCVWSSSAKDSHARVRVVSAAPHGSNTLLQVEEQGEYFNPADQQSSLFKYQTSALLKMLWLSLDSEIMCITWHETLGVQAG